MGSFALGHGQAAQVQLRRRGQRGVAAGLAHQRSVPAAAVRGDQCIQRRRHDLPDPQQRQLARVGLVLQVEEHRVAGQAGVLRRPRPRLRAQQQVGPGSRPQVAQAGVDAVGVGLQQGQAVPGDGGQVLVHARTHAMHAHRAVAGQGAFAEQLRQLARRRATQQVHLEEAFLCMQVTQGTDRIGLVGGAHGGRAQGVAFHRHRRRQAGQVQFAVQRGQAAAQRPGAGGEDQQQHDQHHRKAAQE